MWQTFRYIPVLAGLLVIELGSGVTCGQSPSPIPQLLQTQLPTRPPVAPPAPAPELAPQPGIVLPPAGVATPPVSPPPGELILSPPRPLPTFVGEGYPAQPPSPEILELRRALDHLQQERRSLAQELGTTAQEMQKMLTPPSSQEKGQYLLRAAGLIGRLTERAASGSPTPRRRPATDPSTSAPAAPSEQTPPPTPVPAEEPAAPSPDTPQEQRVQLAQTLFRAKNYDTALRSLLTIDQKKLSRADQIWVQYLMAGCHRKLGRLSEAAVLYREVASARTDSLLTESAIWHLSFIRWRTELEAQLEDSRKRRQDPPPSSGS